MLSKPIGDEWIKQKKKLSDSFSKRNVTARHMGLVMPLGQPIYSSTRKVYLKNKTKKEKQRKVHLGSQVKYRVV